MLQLCTRHRTHGETFIPRAYTRPKALQRPYCTSWRSGYTRATPSPSPTGPGRAVTRQRRCQQPTQSRAIRSVDCQPGVAYTFHIGTAEEPPKSARTVLNRALWKMLANHARHALRVVTDQDPEYKSLGEYVEIGGEEDRDIDFEAYLKGWHE